METRRTLFALVLIVAGIGACFGGWLAARELRDPGSSEDLASTLSALKLPNLEGVADGPSHHPGEIVVLDFWASWCSPCHVQSRLLGNLEREFSGRRVNFFAINVGESREIVRSSLQEHPISFPVLLDTTGENSADAGVFGLPTLIVLGPNGQIVLNRTGLTSENLLRGVIEDQLQRFSVDSVRAQKTRPESLERGEPSGRG